MEMAGPGTCGEVIAEMRSLARPETLAGMARYGIVTERALGISIYDLRPLARRIGTDHWLAAELWQTGIHEARILAAYVDDPAAVDEAQLERWVADFDSWDVCDQVCSGLFDRTAAAWTKAVEWAARDEEFVKRAAFVLMAALSVHDKRAGDARFLELLPLIEREAGDDRNFVKKAVNWALRQIGKRNAALNAAAVATARQIAAQSSRSARWIAADALRELTSEKVRSRLGVPPVTA
jgi:3-methyladenine DNA glycosylase AlkD